MARDPYNANDRFRGTSLIAGAPYGAEPRFLQVYLENADDADAGVRAIALRALGLHAGPEHAPHIAKHLTDEDALVRAAAARALQRIHAPAVAPALLERLNPEKEGEAGVRLEAARALGQYREGRVVEGLISALNDENLGVVDSVHQSLRTLTGHDLGNAPRPWLTWYKDTKDLFASGAGYTSPRYKRDKYVWEYLPFIPQPPYEPAQVPVGMSPTIQ